MKFTRVLLVVALLLMGGVAGAQQRVHANAVMADGGNVSAMIGLHGGLYFSGDSISLVDNEGVVIFATLIDNVRTIVLSEEVGIDDVVDLTCQVMPNPTTSRIRLSGLTEGAHLVQLYALNGRKVMEKTYEEGDWLDVDQLAKGAYLLVCEQKVYKVVKK